MKRLKLKKSPLEVLPVELPDGGEFDLKLKNSTVNQSKQMQRDLIALDLKLNKRNKHGDRTPEITNTEYSLAVLETICDDLDLEVIGDLETTHLIEIAEAVVELQNEASERKKKAKSSAASKNSKYVATG